MPGHNGNKVNLLYTDEGCTRFIPITEECNGDIRHCFARDATRVTSSFAFRRLQHKTQLFPANSNDFIRSRLTHSLDVVQVAKAIAININTKIEPFIENPINLELIQVAALCHDIGHAPFGHSGEMALFECMKPFGGFEGNAQTLRLISKLERREIRGKWELGEEPELGHNSTVGLNLTKRSIASTIKYDKEITKVQTKTKPDKGYYHEDIDVIRECRSSLSNNRNGKLHFPTLEGSIMDIADDIAYATSDLEDAFKVGVVTPMSMISENDKIYEAIAGDINRSKNYGLTVKDVKASLYETFNCLTESAKLTHGGALDALTWAHRSSKQIATTVHHRTSVLRNIANRLIGSVEVEVNNQNLAFSKAKLPKKELIDVEVLKSFNYHSVISSAPIKAFEHRAQVIVEGIFNALFEDQDFFLIPDERREYLAGLSATERPRAISDFIADMTDTYAADFYSNLKNSDPTINYYRSL